MPPMQKLNSDGKIKNDVAAQSCPRSRAGIAINQYTNPWPSDLINKHLNKENMSYMTTFGTEGEGLGRFEIEGDRNDRKKLKEADDKTEIYTLR